jgi:hypothetical protein
MSTLNPLKFVGGLVLEVGAVVAALAILPGLGGWGSSDNRLSNASAESLLPNQVYFNADSSRVLDEPAQRTAPPVAGQNDFAPPPPLTQQRYVENMLDHNSQRAIDAAARLWNQGDRLLPPDLRVRRDLADDQTGEPLREIRSRETMPRETPHATLRETRPITADYRTDNYNPAPPVAIPQANTDYRQPSYYAPRATQVQPSYAAPNYTAPSYSPPSNYQTPNYTAPRYSAQEQPRQLDERY